MLNSVPTTESESPSRNLRIADAFGPVALANYATKATGAHLFRAQHEHLVRLMTAIVVGTERDVTGPLAVAARINLTTLTTLLPLHQALEDNLVFRGVEQEPRSRMVAETFEREIAPLLAELAALSRRYPSASSIYLSLKGEFTHACAGLFTRLHERFKREERDMFPLYDRAIGGSEASPAPVSSSTAASAS